MRSYTWRTALREFSLLAVAAVFAIPLYILLNLAFRGPGSDQSALALTADPTFENFVTAWERAQLGSAMLNSAFVTIVSVTLIVVISSMAGYALVRVVSRLSTFAYWFMVAGLLIPFQMVLIPLYMSIRDLGLLGTTWSLIIFYVGYQMPFSIFLYTGFLRALPREYEEVAWIDGASTWRTFWHVVFPLLRPITGTVVILNGIHIWNDFLTPLLYLSGTPNQTIPVAIFSFIDQYVSDWPLVFAGLVTGVAPILAVFFLLQRNVIKGFASGLKG